MKQKKAAERRVEREYRRIYNEMSEPEVAAFERLKARKKRVRRRKRRLSFMMLLLLLVIVVYFLSPIARVKVVNIYQNKIIDAQSILTESGIQEGKSFTMFAFNYFTEQKIRQNPFINGVDVEKKLDGTINITISERWIIYKTLKNNEWFAYFSDGSEVAIPAEYVVNASVLIPVEQQQNFPYAELAKNLAYVPREIVDKISEIRHNPSNIDTLRFMFYMNDRNRVSILMDNIKTKMKYYDKLVEKSNGERFEYIMEYSKRGIIGRKIKE